MTRHPLLPLLGLALMGGVCTPTLLPRDPRLADIVTPPGVTVQVWAEGVTNARGMSLGPDGTVYVGSRDEGKVHAVRDVDQDGKADEVHVIAQGLDMPVGVAFHAGDLYISSVDRIVKLPGISGRLTDPPRPEVVFAGFPSEKHHGWKYIAFGPDGKLYVPVGAPCNICLSEDSIFATITRMDPDGTGLEIVAHGVRNSVGFDWDPADNSLWFTDNGRDWMGNDMPSCELDHLTRNGQHFGYPFCHQGDTLDPEFGAGRRCNEFIPPMAKLGAHVAPLGMKFIRGRGLPEKYHGAMLIAEHGSWNRDTPVGYRVTAAFKQADGTVTTEPFATGWLQGNSAWGRPVDLLELPDGSVLLSDDAADLIYRFVGTR